MEEYRVIRLLALCPAYRSVRYGTEMARQTRNSSLSMRPAGRCTRPELLVWGGAPAGIEPATPSLPSMRRGFTTPCGTSRPHTTAQGEGATE
jgi:hypothetical protein